MKLFGGFTQYLPIDQRNENHSQQYGAQQGDTADLGSDGLFPSKPLELF